MEAKLLQFAQSKRFTAENRFIYGIYDDVYITITPLGNILQLYFSMSCPVVKAEEPLKQALKGIKGVKSPKIIQKSDAIVLTLGKTRKLLETDTLNAVITAVISAAKKANVVPNVNCVHCGKRTDDVAIFREAACPVCSGCVRAIEEDNRSYTSSPISYITGIIGAVVGALIGAIPWVIISYFGWVLSILASLIALCSFYGYKLFRGPKKRAAAGVIIYASSIFMSIASFIISVFVILSIYVGEIVPVDEFLRWLPSYLQDVSVIRDLLIVLVFSILGIAGIHKKIATYTIPKDARPIGRRPIGSAYSEN
jgi:hypothetical protein